MRTHARIDLDAVRDNVAVLVERARRAQVMAVVKADGYGHGLVPSARAAVAGGATWLGVAFLEEALAVRAAGIDVPLLAWLYAAEEDLRPAVAAGVDLGVYAPAELVAAAAAARATGVTARVHLKVDSGLSRGGAQPADWPDLCEAAAKAEAEGSLKVTGLWSHFAFADGGPDHPTNSRQTAVFREALEVAERAGLEPEVRHLANSAATLTAPHTHFDLVRPGVAVYGLSPVAQSPRSFGLRPAMSLRSTVVLTKKVPAGSGVSYLHRYVTERNTTLALVPLGYADGIPRSATNTAQVLLGGSRRTIAGTVCMDQFVLDVGDDAVETGDEVLLFGPGNDGEPTAQEWAEALGTINYEIVTRVGARVPRTYVEGVS
ncbi:MAG: alanine racemase [Actinobacteria bacterium]|nr:alanine racemase [Actinomycetota bacterium]MCA1721274.1 alanine racemase [Actinomycetota bacterium]